MMNETFIPKQVEAMDYNQVRALLNWHFFAKGLGFRKDRVAFANGRTVYYAWRSRLAGVWLEVAGRLVTFGTFDSCHDQTYTSGRFVEYGEILCPSSYAALETARRMRHAVEA